MRSSDQAVTELARIFAADSRPWEALLDDAAAILGEAAGGMCLIGAGVSGTTVFDPVGVFHDDPKRLAHINETKGFVWSVSERAAVVLATGEVFIAAGSTLISGHAESQLPMPWQEALQEPGRLPHMMLPVRFAGSSVGMALVARHPSEEAYNQADSSALQGPIDVLALALRELSTRPEIDAAVDAMAQVTRSEVSALSAGERQVVSLVSQGLTSADIAEIMYLSPRTVEWHRARILEKLHYPSRAELISLGRSFRY